MAAEASAGLLGSSESSLALWCLGNGVSMNSNAQSWTCDPCNEFPEIACPSQPSTPLNLYICPSTDSSPTLRPSPGLQLLHTPLRSATLPGSPLRHGGASVPTPDRRDSLGQLFLGLDNCSVVPGAETIKGKDVPSPMSRQRGCKPLPHLLMSPQWRNGTSGVH